MQLGAPVETGRSCALGRALREANDSSAPSRAAQGGPDDDDHDRAGSLVGAHANDTYKSAFADAGASAILAKHGVAASPLRICHFFAQILEETGDFRALVENLNYSVEGLMKTWPSRFPTAESAAPFAHKPEAIANKVYGDRAELGNDAPGDGWRYRGRGLLQITGKEAYRRIGGKIGVDLVDNPDLAADPAHCLEIAAAEYATAGRMRNGVFMTCNDFADLDEIETITRIVNGGLINLAQRKQELVRCKAVWLPAAPRPRPCTPICNGLLPPLRRPAGLISSCATKSLSRRGLRGAARGGVGIWPIFARPMRGRAARPARA